MTDPRADRLYRLLPAIYRERDLAAGEPLRALLGVIGEQVEIVEADIEQLYENWFIETCDDWVVPYIADLIGYRTPNDGTDPEDTSATGGAARRKTLVPRRDVAHTIHDRRRKGSLGLIVDVAADLSGWPCRVVEYDRLLMATQSLNHLRLAQGRAADVHDARVMGRLGSALDTTARSVDIRRPQSSRTRGRYNLASVGVFLYRKLSIPVTRMPSNCIDRSERACYTFSVLGNDGPLFVRGPVDATPSAGTDAPAVPEPLTRALLADERGRVADAYYGDGRSFALWRREGHGAHLVARKELVVADLTDWNGPLTPGSVAIDPELGRIAFAPDEAPEDGLLVSYHYGFGAAIGGGEYVRAARRRPPTSRTYRVGPAENFHTLDDAVLQWQRDKPADAVIELGVSDVYTDPKPIVLRERQRLEIRAADGARPLIDLRNKHRDAREFFSIGGAAGSRLTLIGLLVAGRALQLRGHLDTLAIRHCTFVPGWETGAGRGGESDSAPSVRLENVATRVVIEHSIVGPLSVTNTASSIGPLELVVADSIVDATSFRGRAIDAPERRPAAVRLTVLRSTVIGRVQVEELDRAEDSVFAGALEVRRRQHGCVRFCYLPHGSTTPRRFGCQPDAATTGASAAQAAGIRARVRPVFASVHYGTPDYCQLALSCAAEIAQGAHDGSEMGVFHDLDQPQRLANLRARLDEYVPAGTDVGLFFSS